MGFHFIPLQFFEEVAFWQKRATGLNSPRVWFWVTPDLWAEEFLNSYFKTNRVVAMLMSQTLRALDY